MLGFEVLLQWQGERPLDEALLHQALACVMQQQPMLCLGVARLAGFWVDGRGGWSCSIEAILDNQLSNLR